MLNPKAVQLAQLIGENFRHLLVEQEQNVLTLEDTEGERYLVTVVTVFNPTVDTGPLPTPE